MSYEDVECKPSKAPPSYPAAPVRYRVRKKKNVLIYDMYPPLAYPAAPVRYRVRKWRAHDQALPVTAPALQTPSYIYIYIYLFIV